MLRLMDGLKNDWTITYLRWGVESFVNGGVVGGPPDFMYDLINVSKGKVSMYISDRAWMKSLTLYIL
jgi:hypothetical protein